MLWKDRKIETLKKKISKWGEYFARLEELRQERIKQERVLLRLWMLHETKELCPFF